MKIRNKIFPNFSPIFYIMNWKRIRNDINQRKGKCDKCPGCCKDCIFHSNKGCKIQFFRPIMCRAYPNRIDGLKLREFCKYKW